MRPWNLLGSRAASGASILFLSGALAGSAMGPAGANPLPEALVFTHVQTEDADFCTQCPVGACEGIVQSTDQTGVLDFDLFFQPLSGVAAPLDSIEIDVTWPDDWVPLLGEFCASAGSGTVSFLGDGAEVAGTLIHSADEFFPIARILMLAPTSGTLDVTEAWAWSDYQMWLDGVDARAGLACGDCYVDCSRPWADCRPYLDPGTLHLAATQGEVVQGTVRAQMIAWMDPCPGSFEVSASWMEFDAHEIEPGDYEVTVTANTSSLETGVHVGWLRGIVEDCHECTTVILTVTEPVSIRGVTWADVKARYR